MITTADVRRQIQDGSRSTGAIDGPMFDAWLDAHDRAVQTAATRPYEAEAAQRSEDGRTDWDYEQRIERLTKEIERLTKEVDRLKVLLLLGPQPRTPAFDNAPHVSLPPTSRSTRSQGDNT